MSVPKHPNKDIRKAIDEALINQWEFKKLGLGGNSHPWCKLTCPAKQQNLDMSEWCAIIICSTPKNPSFIAKRILSYVRKCIH